MNPSSGYDFEAVGDMRKDFECPICLLLLREAAELPCLHVFCKPCLENWQANPMERNSELLCPSCKNVYQKDQVNGNKYLDKLIKTSLQVKCKENKFGCEWKGTILDHADHEIKCLYKSINCDFVGCVERILRMDQQKHQSQCSYRLVQCQHCKSEIQFINLESHYGTCTEYIVNCPNQGCSVTKPRKQIGDHTQKECSYQVVDCKYVSVGCKHKFQRHCTNIHENEALAEHMNLLLNSVQLTSIELCTVKEKLQKAEEKLQITEERLQKTEEKLGSNEETLVATNENLKKTNAFLNDTNDALQNTKADLIKANDQIVQSNKSMEEFKYHNYEINKICFQLTRFAVDVKRPKSIVESLKNLSDANAERNKSQEFVTKYGENIHSLDKWPELHKTLEDTLNELLYPSRFKQVMDMMETNKPYKTSDDEIFVKVELEQHINGMLRAFFEPVSSRGEFRQVSGTLLHLEEVVSSFETTSQLIFFLPKWNNSNASSFLLSPLENSMTKLPMNNDHCKLMTLNNMVLIKGVKQS